jgi:hypothetical protein
MAEPVTIGGQTFIKTPEGWLDKKTKVRAPESLFTLLNSLTSESTTEYKKLRVRIDSSKPPVSLAGEEYVFDLNQGKWINKKTRDAVNDSLQKVINGVLEKLEAEKASAAPAITAAMGTIGQAAKSNVKKPDGAKMPVNIKINSPIVTMIEKLATIDGYLKQKLDNQKKIAARNISMAKETAIEATPSDASPAQEVKTEDASKDNTAAMATALLVGGLIAAQFEPVQEAFKSLVDGVKGVWNFVSGVSGAIADGLDAFTGSSSTSSTNSSATSLPTGSGSSNLQSSDPNTVEAPAQGAPSEPNKADATPVVNTQSTPNQATPSQPSSGSARLGRTVIGAAVGGAIAGPVGAAVGGAVGFLSAPSSPPANSGSSSSAPAPSSQPAPASSSSAPSGSTPSGNVSQQKSQATRTDAPQPTPAGAGMSYIQTMSGLKTTVNSQHAEKFQGLINDLEATGYKIKTLGGFANRNVAGTNKKSYHAQGMAIDINYKENPHTFPGDSDYGRTDMPANVGDLARKHGLGWGGNWRSSKDTMHFSAAASEQGTAPDPRGDVAGPVGAAAEAIWNLGAGAIEALGSVISAGLGPMASRSITESLMQTAPNTAGEIATAAVSKNAKMAEVNTPAIETGPMIKDPPNISKSGSTDFIQNAPTVSDMSSIDYYLTRMGLGLQQSKYNALGGLRA